MFSEDEGSVFTKQAWDPLLFENVDDVGNERIPR